FWGSCDLDARRPSWPDWAFGKTGTACLRREPPPSIYRSGSRRLPGRLREEIASPARHGATPLGGYLPDSIPRRSAEGKRDRFRLNTCLTVLFWRTAERRGTFARYR